MVKDRLTSDGADVAADTPQHFGGFMKSELAKWGKAVRDAKVTLGAAAVILAGAYAPYAVSADRYVKAAFRHLIAYSQGEVNDKESGLPHLAHLGCCVLFLLSLEDEP